MCVQAVPRQQINTLVTPRHQAEHEAPNKHAFPTLCVMQDILDSGTQSDLLAAAQLLKGYNSALQNQVSRHQHAAHILQVLLKEQVLSFYACLCI